MAIYEDNSHNIWIGTTGGLNFFDRINDTLKPIPGKNGFTFEEIRGIQQDNTSNLWLSTDTKIIKFNPQSMEYKSYEYSCQQIKLLHKHVCMAFASPSILCKRNHMSLD